MTITTECAPDMISPKLLTEFQQLLELSALTPLPGRACA